MSQLRTEERDGGLRGDNFLSVSQKSALWESGERRRCRGKKKKKKSPPRRSLLVHFGSVMHRRAGKPGGREGDAGWTGCQVTVLG